MLLDIASDYEGLQKAALEMFEELLKKPNERLLKLAATATNRSQMLAEVKNNRTLSPGYYSRVGYLLELEETLEIVHISMDDLRPTEIKGVKVVRLAREEFNSKYPPCGNCAQRNGKFAMRCTGCGAELRRPQDGSSRTNIR